MAPFDRPLRAAIEAETGRLPAAALARAAGALSRRYREPGADGVGRLTDDERLAYAAVRLPATAAALDAVFAAVAAHAGLAPASITDLGAGPATALWPATRRWPTLRRATLIDRDPELLRLGLRLWQHAPAAAALEVDTRTGDLAGDAPAADLVVVSYALGEVAAGRAAAVADRALQLARGAVAIVEPGTPAGFARILAARDRLRERGARLAAPCPHDGACPMAGHDWCHFAARLDRSRLHRHLKQGELGWEDEKFSYVVAVPAAVSGAACRAEARIVRRPRKDTGHVRLPLCARDGLTEAVITRRAADYRAARDAGWGDAWPPAARG